MATDTLARVLALSAGSGGGGDSEVVTVTADATIYFDESSASAIAFNNQSKSAQEIAEAIVAGKDVILRLNSTVIYEQATGIVDQVIDCKVECKYDYIDDGEDVLPYITFSGIVAIGLPEASHFKEFRCYAYTYNGLDEWMTISLKEVFDPWTIQANQIGVEDSEYEITYCSIKVRNSLPSSPSDNEIYFITE